MSNLDLRRPAVAGQFYPAVPKKLAGMVDEFVAGVEAPRRRAVGAIAPHAGLVYSGACAAQVFGRLFIPPVVVIVAPNHTGFASAPGGASLWSRGAFATPLGEVAVADGFADALTARCPLAAHDPDAHWSEHAVELELPFIKTLAPDSTIVPIVLAWDDWDRCKVLADALAATVKEWPEDVLLVASSDMTHFESATRAEEKDMVALGAIERLDGESLLAACARERITMCGRGPVAVVVEASRLLGGERGELVDYRNSGMVTGDLSNVVAYGGVVVG
jgi:AmmeMemoRadiSam system protein B